MLGRPGTFQVVLAEDDIPADGWTGQVFATDHSGDRAQYPETPDPIPLDVQSQVAEEAGDPTSPR